MCVAEHWTVFGIHFGMTLHLLCDKLMNERLFANIAQGEVYLLEK
jgi:DNA-binding ferritin-like protein